MGRGKKAPDPDRHDLGQVQNKKDKLHYFSLAEPVTLQPDEVFNIFPGPHGTGWVLTVVKREDLPK